MRDVTIDLENILELVHCAEMYGLAKSTLMGRLANWTKYVSDEEIEAYAAEYLTEKSKAEGYSEEDYEVAIETITEWRNRYCLRYKEGNKND